MAAYRCTVCATNWPATREYMTCPECEAVAWFGSDVTPIDAEEALSRKRHADFERWCEATGRTASA